MNTPHTSWVLKTLIPFYNSVHYRGPWREQANGFEMSVNMHYNSFKIGRGKKVKARNCSRPPRFTRSGSPESLLAIKTQHERHFNRGEDFHILLFNLSIAPGQLE